MAEKDGGNKWSARKEGMQMECMSDIMDVIIKYGGWKGWNVW